MLLFFFFVVQIFFRAYCFVYLDQILLPAHAAISDSSQDTPTNSTSAIVIHRSSGKTTLLSHIISEDHWIVDIGASDHMTGLQTVFSSYESCDGDIKISIVDGSI